MRKPSLYEVGVLTVTMATGAYLTMTLGAGDRRLFLPGETSHGHYQIELACDACHTSFSGSVQEACVRCHGEELERAKDTHPRSKFTDPRNAGLIERIDATLCVTCHEEHVPERTSPMGVTLPLDYCAHCHSEIAEERPSHAGYGFDTCGDAGCHNFHDNTALYEEFLAKHLDEPELLAAPQIPSGRTSGETPPAGATGESARLTASHQDYPAEEEVSTEILRDWERSAHARTGVNCSDCHSRDGGAAAAGEWVERPGREVCAACHQEEMKGFLESRHGMRLAVDLEPMRPGLARLEMRRDAFARTLGCTTCHASHAFDTRQAAVEACLGCHRDRHSLAYLESPHHELWKEELEGRLDAGSGVSCATCHLPREESGKGGSPHTIVQHNQNNNLRPNEKMLRTVCSYCHGLGFSIDSLADPELTRTNFRGRPREHVESLDLVRRRTPSG